MPSTMAIASVVIDPTIQPRIGGLDLDHVRSLMENPAGWPPVLIAERDGEAVLVDGFHRVKAARELGLEAIAVETNVPPGADLLEVAFQANARHGRALALRDRRRHAEHLIRRDPMVSNAAIADRAGLSATTVQRVRDQLELDRAIPETSYVPAEQRRSVRPERLTGDLPEAGIREDLEGVVARFFSPPARQARRRIARYLDRLVIALDERSALLDGLTAAEVANACVDVLGEERAEQLAITLAAAGSDLSSIADALGYRPPQTT